MDLSDDPRTIIIESSFYIFEEIGKKVSEALYHLSHHITQTEEIGEHFSRFEQTLKETIASSAKRTYAQVTATTTPEINRVREIQQRNFERKVQQCREQTKFEVILITRVDPDAKEQLAQQCHAEITAKLQQTVESQMKDNYSIIHGTQKLLE